MSRAVLIALLACSAGCGGAFSTGADDAGSNDANGIDAVSDASGDALGDGGDTSDAIAIDATDDDGDAHEAGIDAAVDAPCTPITSRMLACEGQTYAQVPSQFCVREKNLMDTTGSTPSACQCVETYTCACILGSTTPCNGSGTPTCSAGSSVVFITCN